MAKTITRYTGCEIVAAGGFAGAVFMGCVTAAVVMLWGDGAAAAPLRAVAALVVRDSALDGSAPALPLVAGAIVWMALSVLLALLFSALVSPLWSRGALTSAGVLFGMALWGVNALVVARVTGRAGQPGDVESAGLFVAFAFLFGCPLGWFLGTARTLSAIGADGPSSGATRSS